MELDESDDFGFSAVTEDELKSVELEEIQTLQNTVAAADIYQQKLNNLYAAILPLLNNLMRDPEKDYLYWPDREAKIQAFIAKIDAIVQ